MVTQAEKDEAARRAILQKTEDAIAAMRESASPAEESDKLRKLLSGITQEGRLRMIQESALNHATRSAIMGLSDAEEYLRLFTAARETNRKIR